MAIVVEWMDGAIEISDGVWSHEGQVHVSAQEARINVHDILAQVHQLTPAYHIRDTILRTRVESRTLHLRHSMTFRAYSAYWKD